MFKPKLLKRDLFIGAVCALALLPVAAFADDDISKNLLNTPNAGAWTTSGPTQTTSKIKDANVQGGGAMQVKVTAATPQAWDDAASLSVDGKINNGDKIVVVVWMKASDTVADAAGQANLRLQINTAPYTALGEKMMSVTKDWQMYTLETTATQDYAKGSTNVSVHLGYAKQTIALGPCFILDMGK